MVREFKDQIVTAAIKHSTPCGVAIGDTGYDSYMKADPQSILVESTVNYFVGLLQ